MTTNFVRTVDLVPADGRKSFYGKARVLLEDDGTKVLFSYGTAVCKLSSAGDVSRLWEGWSATTGRHVQAFLSTFAHIEISKGLKKYYSELPLESAW